MNDDNQLQSAMERLALKLMPGAQVSGLERLSGGATQEIWSFDIGVGERRLPLVMRRASAATRTGFLGVDMEVEAAVMQRAFAAGVPVPSITYVLREEDQLGRGFIMARIEGETLGQRIVRDEKFAAARACFAARAAAILARIHALDGRNLDLRTSDPSAECESIRAQYRAFAWPRPVVELALQWLKEHALDRLQQQPCVIHGDFRVGNLIFSPDDIRAVLDWELVHLGDPMEDLAWMCMNSWRFGQIGKPAGGIATRGALFAAYTAESGRSVDPARVRFWEVLSTLRWGITCASMLEWIRDGVDKSIERHMIARRASEAEIDLLRLIEGAD
jgi:aminoglycoside phosphotransferase (APT) family kinase protein